MTHCSSDPPGWRVRHAALALVAQKLPQTVRQTAGGGELVSSMHGGRGRRDKDPNSASQNNI